MTGPSKDEKSALVTIYQTSLIMGLAMLEGAAFFNLIIFLLEGKAVTLISALALLLVEVVRFPTRSGVESWVENQRAMLQANQGLF